MPLHFLCRGWMKDEGEWRRRTLQTGVSKHVQTHRQQWERHTQAVRPNSAPLYSAMYLAHLTSERTHFAKGSKVMSSQSGGWCVCSNDRVCASSVPVYIIYQQRLQWLRTSVYVREDSPLRRLHNLTQGGDEGAGRALGTVEEPSRQSCTKTVCVSHSKNMDTCFTGQHRHTLQNTLYVVSAMSYVKTIKVTVSLRK